jgi:hypothetical protein
MKRLKGNVNVDRTAINQNLVTIGSTMKWSPLTMHIYNALKVSNKIRGSNFKITHKRHFV